MKIKAPFRVRRSAIPGFWILLRVAVSVRDRVLANNPLQIIEKYPRMRVARCIACNSTNLRQRQRGTAYTCRVCGDKGVLGL